MELIAELGVPTQPVSLDEVYLDLSSVPDPVARMSDLVRAIRERLSLDASVGIGPEQAGRQGRLRRREAARLRRPHPRAGGAALRARAAAADPRHRAEDRRAPARRSGSRRSARCSASRSTSSCAASASSHGRGLHDRAHFRDDSPVARGEAQVALGRDHLRPRHRRPRPARADPRRAVAAARRGAARARDRRPHDRDQGPPRRLDHGHPRAHGRGADQRPGGDHRARRWRCCAPTRRRARCACSASGSPRSPSRARTRPRARSRSACCRRPSLASPRTPRRSTRPARRPLPRRRSWPGRPG